jgi:putative Mn2+ efflux pump MntP
MIASILIGISLSLDILLAPSLLDFSVIWLNGFLRYYFFFIGAKMLKEGFEDECDCEEKTVQNFQEYIILSISTSIYALAAGFTLPTLQVDWIVTTICVGIGGLILIILGINVLM